MANSNGKITAPVGIGDIQTVLSSGETSIGRLCRLPVINMWAKYKPLKGCPIDITNQMTNNTWRTDTYLVNHSITPWWRGTDGKFGLNYDNAVEDINIGITSGTTGMEKALSNLALKIDGYMNGWEYAQPNGNGTVANGDNKSYYHFLGYNHRAPQPYLGASYSEEITASSSSPWQFEFEPMEPDSESLIDTRDYITPRDITATTLYTGVALFMKSNDTYVPIAWVSGSRIWKGLGINSASGEEGITGRDDNKVITKFRNNGIYYALPIYCSVELAQPTGVNNASSLPTASGYKVFTMPYSDFVEFTAIRASTSQTIGWPDISNSNVRSMWGAMSGTYSSSFTLDSNGSYYVGTGSSSTTVQVLIVNSLWNGDLAVNTTSPSCAFNQTYTNVTLGVDEKKTIGSCTNVVIDLNYGGWRVVEIVGGESTSHQLRTNIVPST